MSDFVTYEVADRIATLTMDDGKANAFGIGMTTALCDALDRADADWREFEAARLLGKALSWRVALFDDAQSPTQGGAVTSVVASTTPARWWSRTPWP